MSTKRDHKRQSITIQFAGHPMLLLASGCCYWPEREILIVSDLHFEKGSFLVSCGQPLPLLDTKDTLDRLEVIIQTWQPKSVICLGDNVHDAAALQRMDRVDFERLKSLCSTVPQWQWIIGNHDKVDLTQFPFLQTNSFTTIIIDGILFTHEFIPDQPFQIAGHYHPKISITIQGIRVTGKCFAVSAAKMILPSFGTYTGGLDANLAIYREVLGQKYQKYIIFNKAIWKV